MATGEELSKQYAKSRPASLKEALATWSSVAKSLKDKSTQLEAQAKAAAETLASRDGVHQRQLGEKDKEIADAKAETAKVKADVDQLRGAQGVALNNAVSEMAKQLETLKGQVVTATADLAKRDADLAAVTKSNTRLTNQIAVYKQYPTAKDTKQSALRVADGAISNLPGNGLCYINLGAGDQIAPGLTFEVYDRVTGIPGLNESMSDADQRAINAIRLKSGAAAADKYESDLPKGKGSILVISVGPGHTSECRIIHQEPNQVISQGDLIANLVYDKNTKYKFLVYGDFDLSNNEQPKSTDTAAIKRLVLQWGAQLTNDIGPEVDFIVMGIEPKVPTLTAEEAAQPDLQAKADKMKAAHDAYLSVITEASRYGIPVMSQNRFLYYCGYYDQGRR